MFTPLGINWVHILTLSRSRCWGQSPPHFVQLGCAFADLQFNNDQNNICEMVSIFSLLLFLLLLVYKMGVFPSVLLFFPCWRGEAGRGWLDWGWSQERGRSGGVGGGAVPQNGGNFIFDCFDLNCRFHNQWITGLWYTDWVCKALTEPKKRINWPKNNPIQRDQGIGPRLTCFSNSKCLV